MRLGWNAGGLLVAHRMKGMGVRARLITALPVIMVAAWMATRREGPWTPTRLLGLMLILTGLTFLTIAHIQFERQLTRQLGLVTRGVYSRVRHPIYLFSFVAFTGLLLYLDQWWGVLALLPFQPILQHLAGREEKELETLYGERYLRYKQQTWF